MLLIYFSLTALGLTGSLLLGIFLHSSAFVFFPFFLLFAFFLYQIKSNKFPAAQAGSQNPSYKQSSDSPLPTNNLHKNLENIIVFLKDLVKHNEIELRKRFKKDGEEELLISLEDYLNFLLDSLQEIIAWIIDRSENLSIFSAKINYYTTTSEKKSEAQIEFAHEIINLVKNLLESFNNIVNDSQAAFRITDEANNTYQKGSLIMQQTVDSVKDLESFINHTNQYLNGLEKFTDEMKEVLKVIMNMSQKTHMLSLNASIEAARAGEAGKGFKIVATEIQKFSQGTSEATKKITGNLKQLRESMSQNFELIEKSQDTVGKVISNTNTLKSYFQNLSDYISMSVDSTRNIHKIAQTELSGIIDIDKKVGHIQTAIMDFKDQFGYLSESAANITHSAEDIAYMINHFRMDNFQTLAKEIMKKYVDKIIHIFTMQIEENQVNKDVFFDKNYQQIPGTNPPQYHTEYDSIVDTAIQNTLENMKEELLKKAQEYDKVFLAGAITDSSGYAPTHLKAVSQKPNGNYEHDLAFCRDKRLFNDPVSLKAAKNTSDFLLQVYMRDDGTQNIDLSMPIHIAKRHWGCLRAGYVLKGNS